jgi:hypothetical protein
MISPATEAKHMYEPHHNGSRLTTYVTLLHLWSHTCCALCFTPSIIPMAAELALGVSYIINQYNDKTHDRTRASAIARSLAATNL